MRHLDPAIEARKARASASEVRRDRRHAEGVGAMACMVVHWPRPQHAVLLVVVTAIQPQLLDATAAPLRIKPAARQHQANRRNAVLDAQVRGDANRAQAATGEPQALQQLDTGCTRPQFARACVVRQDVLRIDV